MVITCYAVKGGSGTTVVAAGLALGAGRPIVLVDLDGDLAPCLGISGADAGAGHRPGVGDWLASDAPPDHLLDLAVDIDHPGHQVHLVPAGCRPPSRADRWDELAAWLGAGSAPGVVVDAGLVRPDRADPGPLAVLRASTHRLLVTRPCYLSLDRARRGPVDPTAAVLVEEPGRSLGVRQVERSVGAPVVATVPWDPGVARAVDAGLLRHGRLPRPLHRASRSILAPEAVSRRTGVGRRVRRPLTDPAA